MKKIVLVNLLFLITIIGFNVKAQELKKEKFKVYGNCGMCENRIEKAAKEVDGVTIADWNKESKMIEVSFDSLKTDVHKIHMAIAKVGHDTEMHKAEDDVYNKLPGCCRYTRSESINKEEN